MEGQGCSRWNSRVTSRDRYSLAERGPGRASASAITTMRDFGPVPIMPSALLSWIAPGGRDDRLGCRACRKMQYPALSAVYGPVTGTADDLPLPRPTAAPARPAQLPPRRHNEPPTKDRYRRRGHLQQRKGTRLGVPLLSQNSRESRATIEATCGMRNPKKV